MDNEQALRELNVSSREELIYKLKELIIDVCSVKNVKPEEISNDVPFINGPGPLILDSLDALEIALGIKKRMGVELKNASTAAVSMRSLNTLADFIISAPKMKIAK